jgi:hypothetical protein
VIGTGRIGGAVLGRLQGFGCRALACDRRPRTSAEHVALGALLEQRDIVSLHAPRTRRRSPSRSPSHRADGGVWLRPYACEWWHSTLDDERTRRLRRRPDHVAAP